MFDVHLFLFRSRNRKWHNGVVYEYEPESDFSQSEVLNPKPVPSVVKIFLKSEIKNSQSAIEGT